MARTVVKIDNTQFVTEWQKSDSVNSVAKVFGVDAGRIRVKAAFLRTKGVGLKKFPSARGAKVDYTGLAALAKSLAPKPATVAK